MLPESSLAELNDRLGEPTDFGCFRPTIVVGGTDAFDEVEYIALYIVLLLVD